MRLPFILVLALFTAGVWCSDVGVGPVPVNVALRSPGPIGGTTPNSGKFTTLSASGAITSTLADGSAPFVITSTTVVGNLNVSQLLGNTWAIPGSIGATTPNAGAFTTLSATGVSSVMGTSAAATSFVVGDLANATLTGTSQSGIRSNFKPSAAATAQARAFHANITTTGATVTYGFGSLYLASGFSLGTGDVMTRMVDFAAQQPTTGTNNFGFLYSASTSGLAATGNYAFYNDTADNVYLGTGVVTAAATTASTSTTTGGLLVSGGLGVAGNITFSGATGASLRLVTATANGSVATTLGSVGPTGSTSGNPQGWMRISVNGTDRFVPFW